MKHELKQAYRYHRQVSAAELFYTMKAARVALALARDDIAANKTRYPRYTGKMLGARSDNGLQWCEDTRAIGLRFVGWQDEVRDNFGNQYRRDSHRGWYTDSFGDGDTYRGAVWQLTARDGVALYVPGYRVGYYSHNKRQWIEAGDSHAARIDLTSLTYGEARDENDAQAKCDCAREADGIAEREAEKEREYQEAWRRGQEWSDYTQVIHDSRRERASLRREIRNAKTLPGKHVARVLLDACWQLREDSRNAYEAREKLISDWYYDATTRDAFNDGAGKSVIA